MLLNIIKLQINNSVFFLAKIKLALGQTILAKESPDVLGGGKVELGSTVTRVAAMEVNLK
jgi:hypothetical protein